MNGVEEKDQELLFLVQGFQSGNQKGELTTTALQANIWPMRAVLSCSGYKTSVVHGHVQQNGLRREHWWLQMDDSRIIGPSAGLFINPEGERMPRIYLGVQPDWYRKSD